MSEGSPTDCGQWFLGRQGTEVLSRNGTDLLQLALNDSFLTRPVAMESASFCVVQQTFRDLSTWEQPGLLADCAAVVIQCSIRKFLALKEADRLRQARLLSGSSAGSSLHLQRRQSNAKEESSGVDDEGDDEDYGLVEEIAAVVLQTKARQMAAKKRAQQLKEKRDADFANEVTASLEETAAITLQAVQRRHSAQKKFVAEKRQHSGEGSQDAKKEETRDTQGPKGEPGLEPAHSFEEPTFRSPSTFSKKRKLRMMVAEANNTNAETLDKCPPVAALGTNSGSGWGLSAVFYDASIVLLDPRAVIQSLWGVRLLHAVAMEVRSEQRLPELEFTRWVQGPLRPTEPIVEERFIHYRQPLAHMSPPRNTGSSSPSSNNSDSPEGGQRGRGTPEGVRPSSGRQTKLAPLDRASVSQPLSSTQLAHRYDNVSPDPSAGGSPNQWNGSRSREGSFGGLSPMDGKEAPSVQSIEGARQSPSQSNASSDGTGTTKLVPLNPTPNRGKT